MEASLRALKKRQGEASDSDSGSSTTRRKRRKGASYLEEELAKYSKGRGRAAARSHNKRGRRDEEDDLMAELSNFSKRVAELDEDEGSHDGEAGEREEGEDEGGGLGAAAEGLEVDDDVGWMRHRLKFIVDEKEITRRAEDEYDVSLQVGDRRRQC